MNHGTSRHRYGVCPWVTEELKEIVWNVRDRRVGHLMRQNSIYAARTGKPNITTDSVHSLNSMAIALNRAVRNLNHCRRL